MGISVNASSVPVVRDWSGTPDEDVLVGAADGLLYYFERLADGSLSQKTALRRLRSAYSRAPLGESDASETEAPQSF